MKRTAIAAVLLFASLMAGCIYVLQTTNQNTDSFPADLSYDRSQFGNAPFPFWFNLKPVEAIALQNVPQAKMGNPDELLALALLASGDVRDSTVFNKYTAKVRGFVAAARPKIEAERDFWQKGHALLALMRKEFLKTDTTNDLAGYDWYQSRLSTLLATGKFNCISSALLYIILARYFDMTVKAVVLPSHTFVQMAAPNGTIIEIETTSKTGFDWIHDENYYKSRARAWFSSRGLPQSTYEDYTKRRIMEPFQLVCFNMTNQHTSPSVMKFEDIHRLKEMRGFIYDDDADAQKERFAVYGLEFQYLQKHGDFKTADRMLGKIMPVVLAETQRFPGNPDLVRNAIILEYNDATLLLMVHRYSEFVTVSKSALDALLKSGNTDTSEMYKGLLANVFNYMKYSMENMNDFTDAESLATTFAPYAKNQEWFLNDIQSIYGTELRTFWDQKKWPEVVGIIKKQKAVDPKGRNSGRIAKNLEAAYINWSITYSNDGNWPKAKDALKKCVEDSDSSSECGHMLDEMESEHRY